MIHPAMPELPEVETIVRRFAPDLVGRRILNFSADWPRQLQPSRAAVQKALKGRVIGVLGRRGKHILMPLDDGRHLLIHLKMSGRLAFVDEEHRPSHVRARFLLDDGRELRVVGARKFGRLRLVDQVDEALAHLGPEPLDPSLKPARLRTRLDSKRPLKALLLDQERLAGLGNIYSDESLHRARLHPLRPGASLDAQEAARLLRAIRQVLDLAIRQCGTSLDWIYPGGKMQDYLKVYGRSGQPCPGCRQPIEKIRVAQRSTHFCPRCQPGPG